MSEQARRWLKPGASVGTIRLAGPDCGCPHDGERRTVVILGTGTCDGPAELCEQCQRVIVPSLADVDTATRNDLERLVFRDPYRIDRKDVP